MKFLLDENFPLPLYHRLREKGCDAEHVIVLGQRGMPDSVLRQRLAAEEIVFLTNDTEFEQLADDCRAQVIISRLRCGGQRDREAPGAGCRPGARRRSTTRTASASPTSSTGFWRENLDPRLKHLGATLIAVPAAAGTRPLP